MLNPSSNSVVLATPFTLTISVNTVDESNIETPVTDVPTVTSSLTDPGVTVTTAPGSVTIAGSYTSALPTKWHWIDLNKAEQSGDAPPPIGTFAKITGVDSPTVLTKDVTYTITSSAGTETFVQTVSLGSFSTIADVLKTLLASIP
jgi:hypothetical protein